MSAATVAYDALHNAMISTAPACRDDPRFILDDLNKSDVAVCAAICETCPLFNPCLEYARLARPLAGVWAGRQYRSNRQRDT